jgi:hypothetical protein
MVVPRFEGYTLDSDGLMRYNNKIYKLPNDKLRSLILSKAHIAAYMTHLGVTKMKVDLKPLFLWRGMKADTISYVVRCLECQ